VPNPCARPNQQQFTSRLDRKSTCVDADNNRFGRRGNGASRISALFPAAAAKILSPPVVFFAEVEKHATRSLAQMQRKATLSATALALETRNTPHGFTVIIGNEQGTFRRGIFSRKVGKLLFQFSKDGRRSGRVLVKGCHRPRRKLTRQNTKILQMLRRFCCDYVTIWTNPLSISTMTSQKPWGQG
jgi:hypothetical protein